MSSRYEVFISYKVEDSNAARAVSERLLASGLSVWFAEYQIPGDIFDDDLAIRDEIRRAVAQSTWALVFTNDRWVASNWCRFEMEAIEAVIPPSHIVEVRIPPENRVHEAWPLLRDVPAMVYAGSPEAVVGFLARHGWPVLSRPESPLPIPDPPRKRLRFGLSLGLAGFREMDAPNLFLSQRTRTFPGELYYFDRVIGPHRLQLQVNINPHRTALGDLAVDETGSADDREVHAAYRRYAHDWLSALEWEAWGIHLVFFQGRSHLGLTSVTPADEEGFRQWERRYALVLRKPGGGNAGEIDLAFALRLPARDDGSARRAFASLGPVFDAVVQSVEYSPEKPRFPLLDPEAIGVIVANLVLFLTAVAAHDYATTQFGPAATGITAVGLGASGAGLLAALVSAWVRREIDLLGMRLGPRMRFLPTYGRWLDRGWNALAGSACFVALNLLVSLASPLIWILLVIGFWKARGAAEFWLLAGTLAAATGTWLSRREQPWSLRRARVGRSGEEV